jgi:chorismate mutase/prephenate dehydratase
MAADRPDDHAARLALLRERIDAIDAQLLALLQERARAAGAIGEVKREADAPVWRPEREAQVLDRLADAAAAGPLGAPAVRAIWREVMSACREIERRLRVAYLGPEGTFSEQAAQAHFGGGVDLLPCPSFDEVFRAAEAGSADVGIVPVENSTEGAVNRSLDLLLTTPLSICGELSMPIAHHVLAQGATLSGIARVCAHQQALAQCAGWLDRHLPGVPREAVASNAEGARIASLDPAAAALASERAAQRWGLQAIARNVQDDPHNRTRFVVLGRLECAPSGADQTSLILSVPDRAGAVHALIEPLARHGVSMKRFESRPARQGSWEYYFYIDLVGHRDDPQVARALAELRANAAFFKLVGSYPRARG